VDPLNGEALDGLTSAIQTLIPSAGDEALEPDVSVNPVKFSTTGLGGFVASSIEPAGEISGRRVEAKARIAVKAESVDTLGPAVAAVTRALIGSGRADLLKLGILRLELDQIGDVTPPGPDPGDVALQPVTFGVRFEYLKRPAAASGVIGSIPLDVDLGPPGRRLLSAAFEQGSLEWFEPVDDPQATHDGPSEWAYEPDAGRIAERSGIWGGTAAVNANKPGTYLVLRPTPSRPPVRDFVLRAALRSDDSHGIGLVFRWKDTDNFYFFLMNNEKNYRMLAKKVGGSFQTLSTAALDNVNGFDLGTTYRVKLTVQGSDFRLTLDEEPALAGKDDDLGEIGRVGFVSYRNPAAFFYGIDLVEL
jgi:hypothetical protein